MRILVTTWSSRRVGGTETYLERIVTSLSAAGHEIALCYEVDAPAERQRIELPPGVASFCVAASGLKATVGAVRVWRPDVIYAHGLLDPDLEGRLLGVAPGVFFAHSYYGTCISGEKTHKFPVMQPCGRRFGPPCLALYFPRRCGGLSAATMVKDYQRQQRRLSLLRRYVAVVAPSEHMRHEFARHGAARGRVIVSAHGGSDGAAPAMALRARTPRSPTAPWQLLFVGRMDRLKGGQVLLDALPRVHGELRHPLHVTFAGDGPDRDSWMRRARRLGRGNAISVDFAGWLPSARLAELLDRSDLLVMPSLWPEPYGLAGPEANRHGVPVVAFAAGGIPDWLVDGVNGCLAPANPPTVEGLASALVRCLRSLAAGDELRQGALAAARAGTFDAHVAAVLKVLQDAAEGAHRLGA